MQLRFQEKPRDLHLVMGYCLAISSLLIGLDQGDLSAILLVVFVPGYVLVAALFPRTNGLDWFERLALSFGLSIAAVPLFGLALNLMPTGIRFKPVVVTIALFTVVVGLAAYWRRMRLPVEERLSATVNVQIPSWRNSGAREKTFAVALTVGFVVAFGALAYVIATPRPGERFTEFYILGPGGNATGYPTALNVSESASVIFGISNHEYATVDYAALVELVGMRLVYNSTTNQNETVDVNRTVWSWTNVTLADGQNWMQPYTFQINAPGLWKVQFLLFKEGDLSGAYRELHLFVLVT